jgi:Predicted membrane protein
LWAMRLCAWCWRLRRCAVWLRWRWLAGYRRMLGLYAFAYASLHWVCYVLLDMGLDWAAVLDDLAQRPFILVGTLAWLILLVLAITSIPG